MPTMKQRRATAEQWNTSNPVLAAGEMGIELGSSSSLDRFKIGNGISTWSQLNYFLDQEALAALPLSPSVTTAISVAVSDLVNGAPDALNTLSELAQAITDSDYEQDAGRLSQENLDATYAPRLAKVTLSDAAPSGSQWTSQQWGPALSDRAMLARGGVLTPDAGASYIARNRIDGSTGEQTRWEASTRLSGGTTLIAQIVIDNPTDIDVWVDGQSVGYVTAVAGNQFLRIEFMEPGSYDVDVALGHYAGFVQWYWDKTQSSIVAPTPREQWAIIGDSSISGSASSESVWAGTVAHYISKLNSIDLYNLGQGQTGYVESSASYNGGNPVLGKTVYGSASRRAALAALPSLTGVIVAGGANDVTNGATSSVITLAAAALYAQIAKDRPGVPVVVFGVEPGQFAGLWSLSEVNRVNAAIAAAATAAPNVSFIDMRAFPLVYGTGRQNNEQGDGNADWIVQSDGLHNTMKGSKFIGRWMAKKVAPLVQRAYVDKRVRLVGDASYVPVSGIEVVTLVVRPTPGAGEYASPKLANDAIEDASPVKLYEVIVNPGTYTEVNWVVKPYVSIIGTDRNRCIIKGELPASSTDAQIAAASTLWVRGTAGLKNLTITARNMRYPVHSEDVGDNVDAVHTIQDCWIEHFGNDDVATYRTANSQPAGSPWGAIFAWGYGSASGVIERFTDVAFVSPGTPFLVHNNVEFAKPNINEMVRCRVIKTRPRTAGPIQSNDAILSVQGLGSGVRDKLIIRQTEIGQSFISELDIPWLPTTPEGQYADHSDFDLTISDSLIGYQTYNRGKALRINSAGATTSTVRLSGTAVPILFGDPIYFDGADILKGYVYGRLDVSGILVGVNADQTVANTLGRRLGNCTAEPKTLTITFQSGTSVTHTFNQNYTAVSNADIIAALNTTIGANGSAAEYLVSQGERYPNFLDRQRTLRNTGTVSIIRWSAVKFVGGGVQVMALNDPVELFAGVAVDAIPVGKIGRILTEGLLSGTQLRFSPSITEGQPTYLSESSAGAFASTGTRSIGRGHSSGFLYFRGTVS